MSDYNEKIGKRIFEKRKAKKMTREEMLQYINISEVYLGMIERGKRGTSIEHMVQIAEILDMSMDYMILGKEKEIEKADALTKAWTSLNDKEKMFLQKTAERLALDHTKTNGLGTLGDIVNYYVESKK